MSDTPEPSPEEILRITNDYHTVVNDFQREVMRLLSSDDKAEIREARDYIMNNVNTVAHYRMYVLPRLIDPAKE